MKRKILIEEFGQNGIRTSSKEVVATLDSRSEEFNGHISDEGLYRGEDWFDIVQGVVMEFVLDTIIQSKSIGYYRPIFNLPKEEWEYILVLESVPLEVGGGNTPLGLVAINKDISGKSEDEQMGVVIPILEELYKCNGKARRLEEEGSNQDEWEAHELYKSLVIRGLDQAVLEELLWGYSSRFEDPKHKEKIMRKLKQEISSHIEPKRVPTVDLL